MSKALDAWMNGELVGTWLVDRQSHTFRYENSWLESEHCRSLSLSLPISATLEIKGPVVKHYFDNLLPDNDRIRARLGRRFRVDGADTFELLQAIGRDCVGAVQLVPEGRDPVGWNRIEAEPLSDDQVAELLETVPSDDTTHFDEDDSFRISIAGAQEKTALLHWNGNWCRPHGATPTTHIIKLPLGLIGGSKRVDAADSVQNEWLCALILKELGLPVANTSMADFGTGKVLVVERFDREWRDEGTWIARLPQEDFCQALGVAPDHKYESHGGPTLLRCVQLLGGSKDAADRMRFLLTQLALFLLAATDGHAKNFSIFLGADDVYEMTPLYDVLSMWPYFGNAPNRFSYHKAGPAMALRSKNVHKRYQTIHARHWKALALNNGGQPLWQLMQMLVGLAGQAVERAGQQLPPDFPPHTWDRISGGVREHADRFLAECEADEH